MKKFGASPMRRLEHGREQRGTDGDKYADAAQAPNVASVTRSGSSAQRVAEVTKTAGLPLHAVARRRDGWDVTQLMQRGENGN
ncbi:hypothetical protein [Paraburkholderia azotifigens]|nr:hypothetical protein [Paraburkholderia azotifigens]TXC84029.1 hypothetical protein FRZ40_27255 [Paraburkholderia azotifigens]